MSKSLKNDTSDHKKDKESKGLLVSTLKDTIRHKKEKKNSIWRSRLSLKIALSVFITILIVQASVLFFTLQKSQTEYLNDLSDLGRSSIAPILFTEKQETSAHPLSKRQAQRLFSTTNIKGIAIYNHDYDKIISYGDKITLEPKRFHNGKEGILNETKNYYEIVYDAIDTSSQYVIAARLDSSDLETYNMWYIEEILFDVLLLSFLVSTVIMLALGHWLLTPMVVLRNNIIRAVKNPEDPNIQLPEKELNDEIALTIMAANDLIKQNASNMIKLRMQAEDKIHRLAYYDSLTNLPNRALFLEKLDEIINESSESDRNRIAVIIVDLDHFKDINDTMGHDIGDKLLESVGHRLTNIVPENTLVARASADEFIILAQLKGLGDSHRIVSLIFSSLDEPITILKEKFQIRVSIGVSQFPDDGDSASKIVKNAAIALNRSKEEGRDTVRYYSEDFDRAVRQRFEMLRDLHVAHDEKQLQLYYHPQFDLRSGELVGAEALLRWWRPDDSKKGGTFISPAEFIPIAEQSGLIVPIGEWVLQEACKMNKKWQDLGLKPFRIAVNLSGVQFHRGDIVSFVERTLKETQLDPKWLELEVTESVFMDDISTTIETLKRLHALGAELAIDDFGTGYSSLSYLRLFEIDRLKIDQSFIRNALTNSDDMAITRTIINLGHSLGLKVIAEGVEEQEHEDFLSGEGCDEVQGFKYTQPIPASEFEQFIKKHKNKLTDYG